MSGIETALTVAAIAGTAATTYTTLQQNNKTPELRPPGKPEDPSEIFRAAVRRRAALQSVAGTKQSLTVDPQTGVSVQNQLFTGGVALPSQTTSGQSIPTQLFPR